VNKIVSYQEVKAKIFSLHTHPKVFILKSISTRMHTQKMYSIIGEHVGNEMCITSRKKEITED
jgi:hypothetical protein